jgi:protoporphyrinogen oxidase
MDEHLYYPAQHETPAVDVGEPLGLAILGGGPAGLTAADLAGRRGAQATVVEGDNMVGGISRTVERDGYRFDLGGHRFFTKFRPVQRLWEETLGDDFLVRPRLSRIYHNGQFFSYPLTVADVFKGLGVLESARCFGSYVVSRVSRNGTPETFEDWATGRFGRRLYDTFFRTYTQKVWGIPGSEIRAEWAAQRIRNFSLGEALLAILRVRRGKSVPTLINEFHYPRRGPGQMWEAFARRAEDAGVDVRLSTRVTAIHHRDNRVHSVVLAHEGVQTEHPVDAVLSSIPLGELVLGLEPPPPAEVLTAARQLRHRSLCLVALMTTEEQPFPDNWIYLHDGRIGAGRVQNFAAWSEDLVQPGTTCLGVEYFCFEGDATWEMQEDLAIEAATRELAEIGLIDPDKVFAGAKVRVPKAYPMYDAHYREAVETLRTYLGRFENLQSCGRNGLHRYNNQDHSMWTAALALANLLDGGDHDVWSVNLDEAYLERGEAVDDSIGLELLPSPSATA